MDRDMSEQSTPRIGLVICGGAGSRYDGSTEKPLVHIHGEPMVDRVIDALLASGLERTIAVTSPRAPETAIHVSDRVPTIPGTGRGYVADLQRAMATVGEPVLTVAGDLPLVTGTIIDDIRHRVGARRGDRSVVIGTPAARKRFLGLSVDTVLPGTEPPVVPSGINVVRPAAECDALIVVTDRRVAVNVNTRRDRTIAERR